jgi:lysophospholipase L1-like esterase
MEGSGPGITVGVNDITTVTAEILGLPMRNDAIGGASLYNPVWGNGSWADILQKVTRPARFSTPTGVNLTMFGINDLNHLGNTAGALAPFFMAYRACISRWRQGRIFENDDATVTLAGGVFWNLVPQTNSNSGANISYTSAPIDGATVTIAVPGDFPGGTLVLGFLSWTDGGATISGTVNGTVYSINTATAYRTDTVIPNVLRIPNVPAGSGTYVFTVQSHTSAVGAVFDYWAWEPAEADCPLVVLVKQPYPLDYTAYGSVAPGPPTNAGVDALNAGLDALAAEFGARVITVDTSSISSDATCWSAANIHPNAKGSRIIAEKIAAAVRGNITASQTLQYQAKRVEYGTAAPTGTMTKWRVGDQVVNTAPTELGSAASKYVITGWICTVAGAPGTWLQQRTLTGN